LANTDTVLLTHLHIDHAGELPGLFKARAVASSGPIVFDLWGPTGSPGGHQDAYFPSTSQLTQLLFGPKGAYAYLRDFSSPMTIRAHDIPAPLEKARAPSVVQPILDRGGLSITAIAGHHGDAPSVIYRIEHGGRSVTFSGDIDSEGLPALRRIAKGTCWSSTVWCLIRPALRPSYTAYTRLRVPLASSPGTRVCTVCY
jgi:ribonuclease BN (tRNA processing enzyme)